VNEILGENGIFCLGNCGLFLLYMNCNLKIWRMNTADDLEFVRSLHFPESIQERRAWGILEMDDEYIAVLIQIERGETRDTRWFTVYFISTKTFQIERSLSIVCKSIPQYERGFLVTRLSDSFR
jgi:hypothetical protein